MKFHFCLTCKREYECTCEKICKLGRDTDDCPKCWKPFDEAYKNVVETKTVEIEPQHGYDGGSA